MHAKNIISTLSLGATLFSSTTTAHPSRAHCVCTIVDGANSRTQLSSIPSLTSPSSPSSLDICSTLGPELENFQKSDPDRYADFMADASLTTEISEDPTATDEERPLSTTVLLALAAKNGFQNLGVVLPSAPTETPRERIVCRTEAGPTTMVYQDSLVTLLALQIIVGFAILACIAEGVMLAIRIITSRNRNNSPDKSAVRLSGEERYLRAFSDLEVVPSPGVEKKLRVYNSPDWKPKVPSQKREFEAYLEEEDDEISRPVM